MKSLAWIGAVAALIAVNVSHASENDRYLTGKENKSVCAEKIAVVRSVEAQRSDRSPDAAQTDAIEACMGALGSLEMEEAMFIAQECSVARRERLQASNQGLAAAFYAAFNECLVSAFEHVLQPRSTVHDDE